MNYKKTFQTILCTALITSVFPVAIAAQENDVVYGTMQIPYNDFYAEEGIGFEVDAVSSATTSKWKNENLTAGTYSTEQENGGGTIEGVVYPVAISKEDLNALGENNYGFTQLDSIPAAYKEVNVENGKAAFSTVKGASAEIDSITATITTDTRYGDYCIDAAINNANGTSDIGRVFGVILHTANGTAYGMRHLENIWRDEIAWSSGFITEEAHGNTLVYDDYASLVGQTIDQITYITDSGYHILKTNLYVPIKFDYTLTVDDAGIDAAHTSLSMSGFPQDYSKQYSVEGLSCSVTDTAIAYQNALPGSYTLVVHDAGGSYADVKTAFTLTSDSMPAAVSDTGLIKANGASEVDFENFLKNISTVTVGETSYAASGKRGVKIIDDHGLIDAAAEQRDTKVFPADGVYQIQVVSTGYTTALQCTVTIQNAAVASVLAAETDLFEDLGTEPVAVEPALTEYTEPASTPKTEDAMHLMLSAMIMAGAAGMGLLLSKKKHS
ncbi:MAG: hypothetical protein J6I50_11515 [Clostridia bacterium]|nr:hypothetical protein [Clostridia bacterium]